MGRKRLTALPLRLRLTLAFAAVTVVLLSVLSVLLYTVSTRALEQEEAAVRAQVLAQIAASLDAKVREMNRVALTALTDQNLQSALRTLERQPIAGAAQARQQIQEYLLQTMRTNPSLRAVYVWDLEDRAYSLVYGPRTRSDWRPSDDPRMQQAMALSPAEFRVIGPFREVHLEQPGEEVFAVVRPIAELRSMRPIGWVRVDVRVQSIAAQLASTPLGSGDRILVVGPDGEVIYDSTGPGAPLPGPLPGDSGQDVRDVGPERALLVWRRSPLTGWQVVQVVSYRDLTASTRQMGEVTLGVTVIAALLAAAAGAWLAGQVARQVFQARLLQQQSQLRALQAQINPHFLYNSLGTMAAIAELEGVPQLAVAASSLSAMFRYAVTAPGKGLMATVAEELEHVSSFMAVMSTRFGDRFQLEVDLPDEVLGARIPRLSLQPLVENAISHGLAPRPGPGRVRIRGRCDGEAVEIRVEDDGVGLSPASLAELTQLLRGEGESNAVGLRNVAERLQIQFGEVCEFRVESRQGEGFTCIMRVPGVQGAGQEGGGAHVPTAAG